MLARSPATDPLPFRPSVWSERQEPGFHALLVRRERPPSASTTQDPTRPAVFSEELGGGDVTQDWPDGATAVPAPTAEPAATEPVTRAQSETTAPVQAAPRAATAGSNVHARTTEGGATIEAPTAQALQEAYARGLEDGQARARARDEAARQRQEALLKLLLDQLDRSAVHPADWSTPMKRLCLRLAEEIVRGELQQPRTVERLVEQGLSALGESPQRPVVRLHPDDLTVLSPLLPRFAERCRFEAVPGMRRGSVEVAADDTLMQDLIENRLRALADQLFQDDAGAQNGPAAGA
jgi:flagellar biosynthesis/type III secretory pathway protein FliH